MALFPYMAAVCAWRCAAMCKQNAESARMTEKNVLFNVPPMLFFNGSVQRLGIAYVI